MIVSKISELLNKQHQIVIIGSGPAGLTLALELEKKKIPTIIIEAGNLYPFKAPQKFLSSKVIGDTYNDLSLTRLRQFGGTSGHWGGDCINLEKRDFKSWPIKKKTLDPYIDRAKKILNIKEIFLNKNLTENLNLVNLQWSDVRFNEKYLNKIKKSKYVNLCLDTVFVNFNGENKVVKTANFYKESYFSLSAQYFILACGGVENSRLLLWSRKKNPKLISNKLPIGNYYMDHPYHSVGEGLINIKKLNSFFNIKKKYKFSVKCNAIYITPNNNFLVHHKIPSARVGIYFYGIENNYYRKSDFTKQLKCMAPRFIERLFANREISDMQKIEINLLQEQEPTYENKVILDNEVDPLGIPKSALFWKKDFLMKKAGRSIIEQVAEFLIKNNLGRIAINEYLYNDDNFKILVGNHQLGGTRMGEKEDDSVVDKNLKVHGVENLFVCGSSIFRTGGYANPTFSIVQFALRLSDHLLENV